MRNLASSINSSLRSSLVSSLAALGLVALASGCWDFEALQANSPISKTDGGDVPVACAVPNGLQEDCTDPEADVNQDCLKGCQDPLCKYHTACLPSYRSAGNVSQNMMACTGAMPIHQNLQQQNPCMGCACGAGSCSTTLRYGNDAAGCTNMMNMTAISVTSANKCFAFNNGMNTSQYRLSALTPVCTPTQGNITLNPAWGTTSYLCQNSSSKTEQLADLLNNNQCVVFDGDVACPDFRDRNGVGFTTKQVFYGSASGSSQCACSCTPAANSCRIPASTDVRLTDQTNCGNTMNLTDLPADNVCKASTAGAMMTAYGAKAVQFSNNVNLPTCTPGGTPSGQFVPDAPLTLCCKQ
jgi:hypothetical protein